MVFTRNEHNEKKGRMFVHELSTNTIFQGDQMSKHINVFPNRSRQSFIVKILY